MSKKDTVLSIIGSNSYRIIFGKEQCSLFIIKYACYAVICTTANCQQHVLHANNKRQSLLQILCLKYLFPAYSINL